VQPDSRARQAAQRWSREFTGARRAAAHDHCVKSSHRGSLELNWTQYLPRSGSGRERGLEGVARVDGEVLARGQFGDRNVVALVAGIELRRASDTSARSSAQLRRRRSVSFSSRRVPAESIDARAGSRPPSFQSPTGLTSIRAASWARRCSVPDGRSGDSPPDRQSLPSPPAPLRSRSSSRP